MADQPNVFNLPLNVVGRKDINRLLRELRAIDEFMKASALRQSGRQPKLPKTSRLLDELLEQNAMNGLVDGDRQELERFLEKLARAAPVIHISFSVDPSPAFTRKILSWFRQEVHPATLLDIGLQPSLGAGCSVRTTNKYFDLSLRARLSGKRDILLKRLEAITLPGGGSRE